MALDESNPFAPATAASPVGGDLWAQPDDLHPLKADRWSRFGGALLDNGLPSVLLLVLMGGAGAVDPDLEPLGALLGIVGYLGWSVTSWVLIVRRGQSLGKWLVGTRIVTEQGGPVDFVKGVVVRSWLFTMVNAFIGILSLVDVLFIFGDEVQCLHDRIAKTIVVDAKAWDPYVG